jgi:hypothetical protein
LDLHDVTEVGERLLDRLTLAGGLDLETAGDVPIALSGAVRCSVGDSAKSAAYREPLTACCGSGRVQAEREELKRLDPTVAAHQRRSEAEWLSTRVCVTMSDRCTYLGGGTRA